MSKAFGSRYSIENSEEAKEYFEFVKDLLDSDVVNEMKNFRHHYSTTCYQHCINVSYYNYLVCRKLGLNSRSAARAGLLHDLFLYDWRDREKKKGEMPHGMTHPKVALNNAKQHFEIGKREENRNHHNENNENKAPIIPNKFFPVPVSQIFVMSDL